MPGALTRDEERADQGLPALEPRVDDGRHRRRSELLLAHVPLRAGPGALREHALLGAREESAQDRQPSRLTVDRTHDQPIDVREHVLAAGGIAAPPRGDRLQLQLTAEEVLADPGNETGTR